MDTPNYTCSVEKCEKKKDRKGWCSKHYSSWKRHGDPLATSYATCQDCAGTFARVGTTGVPPRRCPECRPKARTECPTCAGPLPRGTRPNGGLATAPKYCSEDCKPRCSVDGCGGASRKLDYCANHYAMWYQHGEIREWSYRWASELICEYCGGPSGVNRGYRKYCSTNCTQFAKLYPGGRPRFASCAGCDKQIDLNEVGKGGKRRRVGTRLCKRCRASIHKHDMTVEKLAARDGTDCHICGEAVAIGAVHPDPFRPSIDHLTPRSRGGTNAPENLKLTHLWCNQVKSDRENFTI